MNVMPDHPLNDAFYHGRRSGELPFVVDDQVRVTHGVYHGQTGTVAVLDWSGAELRYLVEFGDGTDELLLGSALELLSPSDGRGAR